MYSIYIYCESLGSQHEGDIYGICIPLFIFGENLPDDARWKLKYVI